MLLFDSKQLLKNLIKHNPLLNLTMTLFINIITILNWFISFKIYLQQNVMVKITERHRRILIGHKII